MRKKDECEQAIRQLIYDWADKKGYRREASESPSFSEFWKWMADEGFNSYQQFRTATSPRFDAEIWFDEVMCQTWRR